jgi:MSHA biogenesis protein MshQ
MCRCGLPPFEVNNGAQGRAMSRLAKLFVLFVLLMGQGAWSENAHAVTCTSTATGGNWNATATWTGCTGGNGATANTPGSGDTAVIATTGANVITANVAITVGSVVINSGALSVGGSNWTVNGTTTVNNSGTIDQASTGGSSTFIGLVTVNTGGTWSNTSNEAVTFRGGIVNNGSFTGGTATQTFDTGSQTIGGASAISFGGIVAVGSGITFTNSNTSVVTIAGNLTGGNASSTWVNAANSTLNYGGGTQPMVNSVFTASASGNTVNYSRANNQTVKPAVYYHLSLSGSGVKSMAATTINGNFTLSGAAVTAPTGALTVGGNFTVGSGATFTAGTYNHTVSGNFSATGTFTPDTGTVTLNGASAQTISGTDPVAFNKLTVSAANPNITLATNVTVASTLTGTVKLTSTCPTDFTLTYNGGATVLHSCPPTSLVSSIILLDASPTSAATVRWTVTFNKTVTGVDATAFSLAASGVSGAYITAVTGSGATWTVTANTGIGSGTLGLNQSGPGVVVPTLNGTYTGQVYTVTATPALAEYRMDEASWSGTTNDVLDSSGSGNNAKAFNSANTTDGSRAIAGSTGTCRYGVFDNGGTVTQGYVETPLPNLTTDFTITSWIKTANNTVSGQRILIDDQGSGSASGYGFSLADGATGILRFYSRGITPIILDSTYTIANNTWYFVAAVADISNKRRSIYVYNQSGSLLSSTTEAAWTAGAWGTDAGPVSIGAETNASAESPATFHFRGNLDEVRVYQKVLSQNALAAIATQAHACAIAAPDHLEILHASGTGLTCAASTLTIRACADAACSTTYTGGVTGSLSATGTPAVNWAGGSSSFTIALGSSSVTMDVQLAAAGSVVFGISSPLPAPTNATACNFGSPSCTFTANTAGFIYSSTATGSSYTIPPQVSGIAASGLYLRAVQASTTNPAVCTPAIISQTTAVNMGYTCNNPATCQTGNLVTINSTAIAGSPNSNPTLNSTSVSLVFDANGSAPITVQYDDVGQITLNASKTVTPFVGATAITLIGNSNPFVVAPHHFGLSGITAGLIKAGSNFSATVTAYNGLSVPTATANFGRESVAEGVTLTSNLVSPAAGNNPALANNIISGSTFANGVATVSNLSWGEVGLITLTANLTSGNYLGSTLTATGTSGNVGRFYPEHFDTVVKYDTVSKVFMLCPSGLTCPASGDLVYGNGFVYSGQAFTTQVTAKNLGGGVTQNYQGVFSRAVTLSAWNAAGASGVANFNPGGGALSLNNVLATAFSLGVAATSTPIYTFPTMAVAPTDIFVRADEPSGADGVTSLRGVSSVEGGVKVASGRAKIFNAYGSELLQLPMTATVQYYTASGWANSSTDSVTSLTLGLSNYQCQTGCAWSTTLAPASAQISTGVLAFKLSKPSSGGTGSVDVSISAPSYLLAGNNGAAANPSITGRATFGVYRGSNNFIYQRENY